MNFTQTIARAEDLNYWVVSYFTSRATGSHYAEARRIAQCGACPADEIRNYFILCNKIKLHDEFAQAALQMVDWNAVVSAVHP